MSTVLSEHFSNNSLLEKNTTFLCINSIKNPVFKFGIHLANDSRDTRLEEIQDVKHALSFLRLSAYLKVLNNTDVADEDFGILPFESIDRI